MSSFESIPETVMVLRDHLKHGQNVVRILESQVDTAQQNIVLLQGQVRLANETISNLKIHFHETENLFTKLCAPELQILVPEPVVREANKERHMKTSNHASPNLQTSGSESNKSFDRTGDSKRSPYAQQLRDVLNVLRDEEFTKSNVKSEPGGNKECGCVDCLATQKVICTLNCTSEQHNKDDCNYKHATNGYASQEISPKSSHSSRNSYQSTHCTGPCCSSKDEPDVDVEKTTSTVCSSPNSGRICMKNHPGGEACQCHMLVNYVPYGYHTIERSPGITESVQPLPISPRGKRLYVAQLATEEQPNMKYTKVKRIDRSKLSAQKLLQDFTKRRFSPYNPQYDLELLIVPPPVLACDLVKNLKRVASGTLSNGEESIIQLQQHNGRTSFEKMESATITEPLSLERNVSTDDLSDFDDQDANGIMDVTKCTDYDNTTDKH